MKNVIHEGKGREGDVEIWMVLRGISQFESTGSVNSSHRKECMWNSRRTQSPCWTWRV